jgi:predicted short-subunit dehydrogenase-like oxidoreductase (DUF2520 family)
MIKEFSIGVAKTLNMGNYQSMRVEASLTIAVSEGDDYGVLRRQALTDLKALLEENYRVMRKEE